MKKTKVWLLFAIGLLLTGDFSRAGDDAAHRLRNFPFEPLQRAINDLTATYKDKYPKGREFLTRLNELKKISDELLSKDATVASEQLTKLADDLETLRRDALLANPALDFDKLLLVKRKANQLGLPQNWQGNSSIPRTGYDNEIAVLSPVHPNGKLTTLYKPDGGKFVGDLELHWDADRLLFSMPDSRNRWQVFEIRADGTGLRQVTPGDQTDVDNYDGCYLPNGGYIFCSTANYQGVPCVGGADHVGLLYRMEADGKTVRQLTFDQDHSWCPTVLNDGRVLYTRWEYSDTPHYFSRLLFTMNPDGTQQLAYYGSNSYWPNSTFYARPIPAHPSKVVGVISGHHGVTRMGEMILFDPAKGRHEAEGVVQRIPGYGKKVEAVIVDQLVNNSFPKFLHPYPLNEKYYLVSCQPNPRSPWGIYLVDVFDNILLLCEADGYAMLEPIPLRKQKKLPVIPDRVDVKRKDATVYVADVYSGPGMKGVPRGTVKRLRVFAKHFAYRNMGGHIHVGIDGPWDVNAIIGTVPVHDDGSVLFRAPANTPLVVQPLDAEGKAVQVKRSWFTAMPGESVSCVGCHDSQNAAPPARATQALLKGAVDITPWYGPPRGFSFEREVQPVLDKYCVGCHNGQQSPDLRGKQQVTNYRGGFTPAYEALHRYVRRPGPESDYHLLPVMEYHADTSELVQMLNKGHYGVRLDAEAWDRLVTWIDLNVPCHGTWCEHQPIPNKGDERRRTLQTLFSGEGVDAERIPVTQTALNAPLVPEPLLKRSAQVVECPGFPFDTGEARRRQETAGKTERKFDLGNGVTLELVYVPAGEFVMGDPNGEEDELSLTRVRIDKPFWMGKFEITNEQYRLFDPTHDSRYVSQYNKDQEVRGYPVNGAKQPVVRVSWKQAMAFCQWLSEKTGERFTLPTEAQWEYAARAGTATPFFFGDGSSDFSRYANLADATLKQMVRRDSPDWIPKDTRFNDHALVTANVGSYQPNAWGLHDMIGNAAEWTRSAYKPYGGNDGDDGTNKVVRGGSWFDRPHRSRASFRLSYPSWQGIYNVGFRVVCEAK